ncbi:trypsin-like peptidase domain-containing protein [Butyrivibrio sp. LB2008]|uniref:trypsin-like peptidase domain-containing protein n=1 Tax=Butyrivibrio sp. LB2008 TaxID=1408305 RepID=UPI00047928B6|nr:trypsin-like peptidase domain-containing protein [Butyrivibrio sp. LB2008]
MSTAAKRILTLFLVMGITVTPLKVKASEEAPSDNSGLGFSVSENITEDSATELDSENIEEAESEKESEEEETKKLSTVQEARNGVLQVNCIYEDDLGKSSIILGGTGFLIGDPEDTEYVITNNHIVNPDKKFRDKAFKALGVPKEKDEDWDKINLKVQVVVENDVVLEASVVKASVALDVVVLKLEQPIYTRTPLTILAAENKSAERPYKVAEKIFTLGYPTGISYELPVYYSNDKVSMTSGAIANLTTLDNTMVIQHDAKVDSSNCGGPLINEDGLVIGMNELIDDGSNYYTLDAAEITAILDGLGIAYNKMNAAEYDELKNGVPATTESSTEASTTGGSVEKPVDTVDTKKIFIIVVIAGVSVVVLAAIALTIILVSKKVKTNKEKARQAEAEQNRNRFETQNKANSGQFNTTVTKVQSNDGAFAKGVETTLLNTPVPDAGTTVLSASTRPDFLGTLIRRKNGENIIINKNNFSIGKDSLNIDFRISDNSAISRRHASIKIENGQVVLEDNFSTNGTFVNGNKIQGGQTKQIKSGDVIKLANEEFDYRA